ncbi:PspA-associated protein PspAB [Actinomadura madurae]|uniref:PspA-associated protein PspAB n=1 Tax=Actinomadura madurae TaxID=1993 RepID=UPI0035585FEF
MHGRLLPPGRRAAAAVHRPFAGPGDVLPVRPPPPDVPGENRRNNLVEAHARDALAAELPMEPDTARWFPLWDAPGL